MLIILKCCYKKLFPTVSNVIDNLLCQPSILWIFKYLLNVFSTSNFQYIISCSKLTHKEVCVFYTIKNILLFVLPHCLLYGIQMFLTDVLNFTGNAAILQYIQRNDIYMHKPDDLMMSKNCIWWIQSTLYILPYLQYQPLQLQNQLTYLSHGRRGQDTSPPKLVSLASLLLTIEATWWS